MTKGLVPNSEKKKNKFVDYDDIPPLKIAHELKYQNLDRYILTTEDIII